LERFQYGSHFGYGFYSGGLLKNSTGQAGPSITPYYNKSYWTHLTAVWDSGNSQTRLYINGELTGTSSVSYFSNANGGRLVIGGAYNSNNTLIKEGSVDIACYHQYNRVLTTTEITQNFNAQKTRFGLTADTIVTSGLTLNLDAGSVISYPTTGTSWYDVSGNNYNGTLNNGPTFVSSGMSSSFILDGTDDYISIPNGFTNMFKGKTYWTASIWIKVNSWGSSNDQYPVLVSIGANQGQYGELYLEIGNAGQYYFAYAGDFSTGSLTTNLNQIYNLVYMKDGSNFKVYSNGVLIETTTGKTNVSNVDGDLWLGRFKTFDFDLNGNMYNFSMYNRALTNSEVLQNYNALKGRYGL
jgi:hypothetical protein